MLLELLQANGARMDVLCKCLEKLLCAEDADSRQILRGPDGARMLLENDGVTLQWIGWDRRGTANVLVEHDGTYTLTARQQVDNGQGSLAMDGYISEIGPGYFTFRGTITIEGAPDRGRYCSENKLWHFAVTQNRRYWRLREFEWCDDLTDYIDIYM